MKTHQCFPGSTKKVSMAEQVELEMTRSQIVQASDATVKTWFVWQEDNMRLEHMLSMHAIQVQGSQVRL